LENNGGRDRFLTLLKRGGSMKKFVKVLSLEEGGGVLSKVPSGKEEAWGEPFFLHFKGCSGIKEEKGTPFSPEKAACTPWCAKESPLRRTADQKRQGMSEKAQQKRLLALHGGGPASNPKNYLLGQVSWGSLFRGPPETKSANHRGILRKRRARNRSTRKSFYCQKGAFENSAWSIRSSLP